MVAMTHTRPLSLSSLVQSFSVQAGSLKNAGNPSPLASGLSAVGNISASFATSEPAQTAETARHPLSSLIQSAESLKTAQPPGHDVIDSANSAETASKPLNNLAAAITTSSAQFYTQHAQNLFSVFKDLPQSSGNKTLFSSAQINSASEKFAGIGGESQKQVSSMLIILDQLRQCLVPSDTKSQKTFVTLASEFFNVLAKDKEAESVFSGHYGTALDTKLDKLKKGIETFATKLKMDSGSLAERFADNTVLPYIQDRLIKHFGVENVPDSKNWFTSEVVPVAEKLAGIAIDGSKHSYAKIVAGMEWAASLIELLKNEPSNTGNRVTEPLSSIGGSTPHHDEVDHSAPTTDRLYSSSPDNHSVAGSYNTTNNTYNYYLTSDNDVRTGIQTTPLETQAGGSQLSHVRHASIETQTTPPVIIDTPVDYPPLDHARIKTLTTSQVSIGTQADDPPLNHARIKTLTTSQVSIGTQADDPQLDHVSIATQITPPVIIDTPVDYPQLNHARIKTLTTSQVSIGTQADDPQLDHVSIATQITPPVIIGTQVDYPPLDHARKKTHTTLLEKVRSWPTVEISPRVVTTENGASALRLASGEIPLLKESIKGGSQLNHVRIETQKTTLVTTDTHTGGSQLKNAIMETQTMPLVTTGTQAGDPQLDHARIKTQTTTLVTTGTRVDDSQLDHARIKTQRTLLGKVKRWPTVEISPRVVTTENGASALRLASGEMPLLKESMKATKSKNIWLTPTQLPGGSQWLGNVGRTISA